MGEPPHGTMWMLHNGSKFRNRAMYKHDNETDLVRAYGCGFTGYSLRFTVHGLGFRVNV